MLSVRFGRAVLSCWLLVAVCGPSAAQSASPTELISDYRVKQGLGRVTRDATLDGIAQAQATGMATKDKLDHDVIGAFGSRMASSSSGRAAENIAYGHPDFPKTLDQWIRSSGHRKNLLMPGASRVGVASAKSEKTGRTYWAMIIAGDYVQPKKRAPAMAAAKTKSQAAAKPKGKEQAQSCRMKLLGLCF
jgi:hypothetical protein